MFSCECGHFRLSVLADWLVDWPDYVGRFCPGAPLAQRSHKHGSNLPLHCSGMPHAQFLSRVNMDDMQIAILFCHLCSCVRQSVRLYNAGIVSKRKNIAHFFNHAVGASFQCLSIIAATKFQGKPRQWGVKTQGWGGKYQRFLTRASQCVIISQQFNTCV